MLQTSSMPSRPIRVKCKNEQGKTNTLPEDRRYFQKQVGGTTHLFFGLGPNPARVAEFVPPDAPVFFLECSRLESQMCEHWRAAIPENFQAISTSELGRVLASRPTIWTYQPGTKIFPTFWSHIQALAAGFDFRPKPAQTVMLAASETALIKRELQNAFARAGLGVQNITHTPDTAQLLSLLQEKTPLFWLSINFSGLDPLGENIALLRHCGVPVLTWCVDNPFHLLSQQKSELWKTCELLVTDKWFVPRLRHLGAKAWHLPLATDPNIFAPAPDLPQQDGIYFVGSSSFPKKNKFFAGCTLNPGLEQEARQMMRTGNRPDLDWWLKKEGEPPEWFNANWRQRGFAAESMSLAWRRYVLATLSEQETPHIYGDKEWKQLVPKANLRAGVDYYAALPKLYATAEFSLNLTSLQLPHGLTQRHFDTWAAGGFLLTDASPGLDIFPDRLTRPIRFSTPQQALGKIAALRSAPELKQELRLAWQQEILARHTYLHRVQNILEIVKNGEKEKTLVSPHKER